MTNLLPAVRSVYLGRFVQGRIYPSDSRQINNGVPASLLPQLGCDIDRTKPLRFPEKHNRLDSERLEQMINDASRWRQEVDDNSADDNSRYKMWQIAYRLCQPLK
ncbi:hypothetical protein D3C85_1640050 [compost metagenome]